MQKIIYIIGIKGRTGAMFGHELRNAARIVGIDQGADFGAAVARDYPDFIWMATRNPVSGAVRSYYPFFKDKEKLPALILSQNGLSAVDDARAALKEALGQDAERVSIIRVSLCNQVEADNSADLGVKYKLPIRIGFGLAEGREIEASELGQIFKDAGFVVQKFSKKGVADMEYSKLMSNLIGMAAAASGMAAGQGLRDKKVFAQEVAMLKEFAAVARAEGVKFARLGNYPMNFVAAVINLPIWLLLPYRGLLAKTVEKKRAGKPKDISEIDYYNGEVVRLGKKLAIPTPVNEEITRRAKEILNRS